jgi:arylsulfatase A-like enzyme
MSSKPNIIIILADHQAYYGHQREGEFDYRWPNFDAFAAQGVRFERAYTVLPLCSPARASLWTGVYPSRHGLRWNNEARHTFNRWEFEQGQRLYSHYLSQTGYRNAYVGKWHCGEKRLPVDYGIDGWSLPGYGKVYASAAYRRYAAELGLGEARAYVEHYLGRPEWRSTIHSMDIPVPWHGSGILQGPPEAHEEFFIAHLAISKLRELSRSSQPFSLVVSLWGPHQPFYPTEPYASMVEPNDIPEYPSFRDDLSGRPLRYFIHRDILKRSAAQWSDWSTWQEILARCYGQGLQLDAAVGRILKALDELGLAQDSLVVWCADHGDAIASHGGLWDKGSTFTEEVGRVPLAIRWPQGFKGGKHVEQLVSNMDVTATLLEAAGVAVPDEMDSRNLLPLCRDGEPAAWPEYLICEHHGVSDILPQRIIIGRRHKYVAALFDSDELYDLEADPYEMNNLVDAPEQANVRRDLRERVIEHMGSSMQRDPWAERLLLSLREGL